MLFVVCGLLVGLRVGVAVAVTVIELVIVCVIVMAGVAVMVVMIGLSVGAWAFAVLLLSKNQIPEHNADNKITPTQTVHMLVLRLFDLSSQRAGSSNGFTFGGASINFVRGLSRNIITRQ